MQIEIYANNNAFSFFQEQINIAISTLNIVKLSEASRIFYFMLYNILIICLRFCFLMIKILTQIEACQINNRCYAAIFK